VPCHVKATKLLPRFGLVLLALLWLWFIWPTPWDYFHSGSTHLRVNRFTGATEVLTMSGWTTYAAKRDIFDRISPDNPYSDLPNKK
jgi:hypothetical protein